MQIVSASEPCLGPLFSAQTNPSNYRSKEFDVICEHSFHHIGACQPRTASLVYKLWDQSECLASDVQIISLEDKPKSDQRGAKLLTIYVFNKQIKEENTKLTSQGGLIQPNLFMLTN